MCDECRTKWNTFETHAKCPGCGKVFRDTACLRSKGGCGQMSLNADWYQEIETPDKPKRIWSFLFGGSKNEPPVTEADQKWIGENLLYLSELFTPEVFKSFVTITPDVKHFNHRFTGIEEDAEFILQTVAPIMNVKPWEIQLMYFSEWPTRFQEGITATPSDKIHDRWNPRADELVDKGFGHKEIWLELEQLKDPIALTATIATQVAAYKLTAEYALGEDVKLLADFTAIALGFGIFKANSYFKFSQWQGNTHHGWQMRKEGGLPEPVIAYTMAWLAHYRNEDISWKHYLNPTVKKYFEKSYAYIAQNKDAMKWSS
jgi:hypothetical protein